MPSDRPLYVIASPGLRAARSRWDRQIAELTELLPDAKLITFADLPDAFAAVPAERRTARLARAYAGAIAIPDKIGRPYRRWLGPVAVAEAEAFIAAGKQVLVYAAGELAGWTACELRPDDRYPGSKLAEVLVPRFRAGVRAA